MPKTEYLTLYLIAFLGQALNVILKAAALKKKANVGNLNFSFSDYFKNDGFTIIGTQITIILFGFFIENILVWKPTAVDYLRIGAAFVGYTGSDIALRLFSFANKKINAAIDVKTDALEGTGVKTELPSMQEVAEIKEAKKDA